jgi:transcription factor SPN1
MPDRSMPSLKIRDKILKLLLQFEEITQETLKIPGIGKAIRYLYKHPKETKKNKKRAGKLSNDWAHLILNAPIVFKAMTKNMVRCDLKRMPKKWCTSDGERQAKLDINMVPTTGEAGGKTLQPGHKGWVTKARVPRPYNKVYAVRSKRENKTDIIRSTKKRMHRSQTHLENYKDSKHLKTGKGTTKDSAVGKRRRQRPECSNQIRKGPRLTVF